MEEITSQELIYAAHALRVAAGLNDKKAVDVKFFSSKEIFEDAAKGQRELAEKFTRISKRVK